MGGTCSNIGRLLKLLIHKVAEHEGHAFDDDGRRNFVVAVHESKLLVRLLPAEHDEPWNTERIEELRAFLLNIFVVHNEKRRKGSSIEGSIVICTSLQNIAGEGFYKELRHVNRQVTDTGCFIRCFIGDLVNNLHNISFLRMHLTERE